MKRIHLYLGAHKTATTHLQGILLANREAMRARGVALSAPQDVRKEWLPLLFRYCNGRHAGADAGLAAQLRGYAPAEELWILTEENIAGVSNDFALKPGMYPALADRIGCIVELFAGAEVSFFFSVRSYDEFYRSAYSEVVRNRGFLPFSAFYEPQRFAGNSWARMLQDIARVLPPERMVVWRYEDFRALLPRLVGLLTGLPDVETLMSAYRPEVTRPSLSARTIEVLESLAPVLNRKESLALVERINRAYALDAGFEAYRPFSPEQEAQFRRQYASDIELVRTGLPGLRFLQP